jgi:peptidoglycan/LPS O-acetylase OafA/YrhL
MGVAISYFYHFNPEQLNNFYHRFKYLLLILVFIPFLFVPFPFFYQHTSFFIKTIGFTLIYISFGSLLIIFLLSQTVKNKLPRIVTPFLYRIICIIGFYSYSIYLFHMYVIKYVASEFAKYQNNPETEGLWITVSFVSYVLVSILLGISTSYLIEIPFLRIRDKYFPRRKLDD